MALPKKRVVIPNVSSRAAAWVTCAFVALVAFLWYMPWFKRPLPFVLTFTGFLAHDGVFFHAPAIITTPSVSTLGAYLYDAALGAHVALPPATTNALYATGIMQYPLTATLYVRPSANTFVTVQPPTYMAVPVDSLVRFNMFAWVVAALCLLGYMFAMRNKQTYILSTNMHVVYIVFVFRVVQAALDWIVLLTFIGVQSIGGYISNLVLVISLDYMFIHAQMQTGVRTARALTSRSDSVPLLRPGEKPDNVKQANGAWDALQSAHVLHSSTAVLLHAAQFIYLALRVSNLSTILFPAVGWTAWTSGVPSEVVYLFYFFLVAHIAIPVAYHVCVVVMSSRIQQLQYLTTYIIQPYFVLSFLASMSMMLFTIVFVNNTAQDLDNAGLS